MKVLVLLKNGKQDAAIIAFASSIIGDVASEVYLLNLVQSNGEIPIQPNGCVLDFCTEFDLSVYEKKAARNLAYLHEITIGNTVKRAALVGNKVAIVKHYVAENEIDLVIGGGHKTTLLEELFSRTFSEKIIESIPVPYLSIKCNRDGFKPIRIALIRDFLQPQKENLAVIKQVAARHTSELVLVKVKTPDEQRSNKSIHVQMDVFAAKNELSAGQVVIESDTLENGLEELNVAREIDLLAIGKLHRNRLLPALYREERSEILNHVYAPLLIY